MDIDGVNIDEIIKIENHAYCRAERTSTREVRERYVVYVQFDHDGFKSIEELDVDATDRTDAGIIAGIALLRDYEPGGEIITVEGPKIGFYL